ncbi:MAG: ATP-binding cassette domain-containing protein [Gammaproteobacteria bacterium]|nr:ATP-binding cassette domain-containing protein [Gammaproteobacteria bacterium]
MTSKAEGVVVMRDIVTRFGEKLVHDGISLDVYRGEVLAVVGGSGSGKSTLMREMVMLQAPTSGSVTVLGREVTGQSEVSLLPLRRRLGVMFQHGALFGGQTVLENVGVPLREHTELSSDLIDEVAVLKLRLAGLDPEVGAMSPSQLSGGMRKRAALARALALDPELIFLDEPSSGLDPVSADELDDLILQLKQLLGLTIVMVTYDMDSLWRVADRVLLLGGGRILGSGTMQELARSDEPAIQRFFAGPRARAAGRQHDQGAVS